MDELITGLMQKFMVAAITGLTSKYTINNSEDFNTIAATAFETAKASTNYYLRHLVEEMGRK